jgi:hypothetical protein
LCLSLPGRSCFRGDAARREARCARGAAVLRARSGGSLRSGRGGRRGRLAPCRGPVEGARGAGILTAIGSVSVPTSAWPLILPASGHPARTRAPARTDARWASVPGARRPRLPPLTLGAEMGKDPEGSCARAPSRTWPQRRRLRSPAHCVGTRSRRLRCRAWGRRAWGLGAEDTEARRLRARGTSARGTSARARGTRGAGARGHEGVRGSREVGGSTER